MFKKFLNDRRAKKNNKEADLLLQYNRGGMKMRSPEVGTRDFMLKTTAENIMARKRKEAERITIKKPR